MFSLGLNGLVSRSALQPLPLPLTLTLTLTSTLTPGCSPDNPPLFKSLVSDCIASASLGQVYRGATSPRTITLTLFAITIALILTFILTFILTVALILILTVARILILILTLDFTQA